MTLRNLLRNRLRTLAGIFGAAMGGSVLVNGFMMQKSTHYFLDFQFEKVLRSDYDLLFKDERGREALDEADGEAAVQALSDDVARHEAALLDTLQQQLDACRQ